MVSGKHRLLLREGRNNRIKPRFAKLFLRGLDFILPFFFASGILINNLLLLAFLRAADLVGKKINIQNYTREVHSKPMRQHSMNVKLCTRLLIILMLIIYVSVVI